VTLCGGLDVLRSTDLPLRLPFGVEQKVELRRDHHLVAVRGQRFGDQLPVDPRPVRLGGVEVSHTPRSTAARITEIDSSRVPEAP
jgi:hypothetical protein